MVSRKKPLYYMFAFTLIVVSALIVYFFSDWQGFIQKIDRMVDSKIDNNIESRVEKKVPLYWVAPMDPNYRRSEPGLSPMGMELVPVYSESSGAKYLMKGAVKIPPDVQTTMGIKTVTVEPGNLQKKLRAQGRITFDQTRIDKLSPRVTGWIEALFVAAEGETVTRGQPLYAIYSEQLIKAQEDFLTVYERGNSTDILVAEDKLKAMNVDEFAIQKLKDQRTVTRSLVFHSEKDGVVSMLRVAENNYLEPGDIIMAIGSLDSVWAELNIFPSQASLIKRGQLLTVISPAAPGLQWQAEIDYIFPALHGKEQNLRFRAKIINSDRKLKPNMHVKANIQLPDREEALLIPYHSVIRLGEQNRVVWAMPDNHFKSVEVTLGAANMEWIEVVNGLVEGDEIVTSGHFLIDSDSSQTSDFIRVSAEIKDQFRPTHVLATIVEIQREQRQLRLQHEAIKAWDMPAMTMEFQATKNLDLSALRKGQRVRVHIANGEPLFLVLDVQSVAEQ